MTTHLIFFDNSQLKVYYRLLYVGISEELDALGIKLFWRDDLFSYK